MTGSIHDIHTHRADATRALISVDPRQFDPQPDKWYSVGFHPWHDVDRLTDDDFDVLQRCSLHPRVLAIGETGMDRLRGASLDVQERVFIRHLQLAAATGMPVIAHCVRTAQDILAARNRAGLSHVTVVVHGMRSNRNVARMLLDAGCYLSFGALFNVDALLATPLERLLIETDDSPVTVDDVAAAVAAPLAMTADEVIARVSANAHRLLFPAADQREC